MTELKNAIKNTCGLNKMQMNLILISMMAIVIQGIGFFLIDREKMRLDLFLFVIIFGLLYNIMFFKTYAV